jgi:hypothetical protein
MRTTLPDKGSFRGGQPHYKEAATEVVSAFIEMSTLPLSLRRDKNLDIAKGRDWGCRAVCSLLPQSMGSKLLRFPVCGECLLRRAPPQHFIALVKVSFGLGASILIWCLHEGRKADIRCGLLQCLLCVAAGPRILNC